MRRMVRDLEMEPVVPPKKNRLIPWKYDRKAYKKRNEVERLFRRLKGFLRIFSRFEKLDVMFTGFISLVLAVESLYSVNMTQAIPHGLGRFPQYDSDGC